MPSKENRAGAKDYTPDFPQPVKAPKDAPTIFLVLLEEVRWP